MSDNWKFRGYDAVGKKGWVYGDLVHNQKVTKEGLEPRVMVGGYEVFPESVGIWTGLHDKDGVEIYENDIMGVNTLKVYVSYLCTSGGFKLIFNKNIGTYLPLDISNAHLFSVVGNCFENFDLLDYDEKEEK